MRTRVRIVAKEDYNIDIKDQNTSIKTRPGASTLSEYMLN